MADKYIRFSNKADTVSRIGLEKLGYSTKRNDPSTIGQFGSGIKFAPIAALRKGWEWHFIGKDNSGEYHLQYCAMEEDGINSVFYDYGDVKKPSSFTVDAGVLSWVDAFQIYREAFANAIDESDCSDDWTIDVINAEDMAYQPGWFSCFITASPELMEVHRNFDKYFSVNKTPLYKYRRPIDDREYSIFKKEDQDLRIYCSGVLVFTSKDHTSLFDYDIQALQLNEERNLKSIWDTETEIVRLLTSCDDPKIHKVFLDSAFGPKADNFYEFAKIYRGYWSTFNWDPSWMESFEKLVGERVIIYDKISAARGVKEFITLKGYNGVYVESDAVFDILKKMGAKDYTSIADESFMYNTDFDIEGYPNLMQAIKIAAKFEPKIQELADAGRIGIYSGSNLSLGLTINMNKPSDERVILVEEGHSHEEIQNVLATLIHEYDHLSTGYMDGDHNGRVFRDLADARTAEIMIKHYEDYPVEIVDGVLFFPMKDWLGQKDFSAVFSFQHLDVISKCLLIVGSTVFSINSDAEIKYMRSEDFISGKLSISDDGKSFCIPEIINVTEIKKINV